MPLHKLRRGEGGGGGGSVASSFQLLAADPGAPANGDVWYNATDDQFRGRVNSVTADFAMETKINAELQSGANPAAKINAAIAAASDGDTVDARGLSGSSGTTIILNKGITLLIGRNLSFTVSPAIIVPVIAGSGSGDSKGPIIRGVGRGVLGITPMTGGVGIRVEGHDVKICDIGIKFLAIDASNVGIQVQPGADPNVLRPYIENVAIDGAGSRTSVNGGSGITFDTCFVGSVTNCHVHGWLYGIRHTVGTFSRSNAIMTTMNRVYDNTEGIRYENFGDAYVYNNTIEGNADFGVHIINGSTFFSEGNHYENSADETGALTASNVFIEGLSDGLAHWYSFKSDKWDTPTINTGFDIFLGAGAGQYVLMEKALWQCEVSIGSGQPPAVLENARALGSARLSGAYSQLRTVQGGAQQGTTLEGPSTDFWFGPWTKLRTNKTFTDTSGTVTYNTVTNTINPGADSSGNFQPHIISTVIPSANAFNLTNIAFGEFIDFDHQGTGALSNARPLFVRLKKTAGAAGSITNGSVVYAAIENDVASTWTTVEAIRVPSPSNSGTIGTFYALRIDDPTASGITNKYSIYSFGGNLQFTLSGGYSFNIDNSLASPIFNVGQATGIGIGIAASTSRMLFVNSAWTDPALSDIGLTCNTQYNPTGAKATESQGVTVTTFSQTANAQNFTGIFYGGRWSSEHRGTATMGEARALFSQFLNVSTGIVTQASAFRGQVSNQVGGTITTGWGLLLGAPSNPSGTFTTYEGVRVTLPTSGTFTTVRGIYITDPTATITTTNAIRTDGGNIILNDNGGAWDVRIETDNVTNAFSVDGTNDSVAMGRTTNTTSFFGVTQPAAASGVKRMMDCIAGAHTGLTASTEVQDVYFDLSRTVNWASGAIATQRAFFVDAPTYSVTAGVSQVITTAATFAISGPPVAAGDGTTITNSYAFWVQTGRIVADGGLLVGAEPVGVAGKVGYTNTVDNTANSTGVGTILFKGATNRNSSGFLKILDGVTPRFVAYFDAITG